MFLSCCFKREQSEQTEQTQNMVGRRRYVEISDGGYISAGNNVLRFQPDQTEADANTVTLGLFNAQIGARGTGGVQIGQGCYYGGFGDGCTLIGSDLPAAPNSCGDFVTHIGHGGNSNGADYSSVLGAFAVGSGDYGIALGYSAAATATEAIAVGNDATASHAQAIVIGDNITSGQVGGVYINVTQSGTGTALVMSSGEVLLDSSTARAKKDIVDTSLDCLDLVNKLKVRDFVWKDSFMRNTRGKDGEKKVVEAKLAQAGCHDFSLIAEEAYDVHKSFASVDGFGEKEALDHVHLLVACIGAIQELSKRCEKCDCCQSGLPAAAVKTKKRVAKPKSAKKSKPKAAPKKKLEVAEEEEVVAE
jgi:hypothetical protein